MANPAPFPEQNFTFKGDGKDIQDLQVHTDGSIVTSCWQLTDEELAEVLRTRCVFVRTWCGRVFYPQLVLGTSPFPRQAS